MLQQVTAATVRGDKVLVHRLVRSPQVATRILAYGRHERRLDVSSLHVDPSITLGTVPGIGYGAGFYLIGKDRTGSLSEEEQMVVSYHAGKTYIVGDQPAQEW